MGFLLLSSAAIAVPAQADAPAAPLPLPTYSVTMTAYNAVPAQTDSSPLWTASGAYSNPQVVAARSQDLAAELPYGTVIEVLGPAGENGECGYAAVRPLIGYRVIADAMNAAFTDRIDILLDTRDNFASAGGEINAARVLGKCDDVAIRVVGFVDLSKPGNLPQTQSALAALVEGGSAPLAVR